MARITLEKISLSFSGRVVFDNFDFTVGSGEAVAVMGHSGCGKSTLLNIIARLIKPSSGIVSLSGTVSYAFQEANLAPWLTAAENVNLVLGDKKETLQHSVEILLALGFEESETKKYPRQLSGGMKRRVSLARAFAYGGDILLLDEPFKELDAENVKRVADYIISNYRDKTIVMTTHSEKESELLGARIIKLI